MCLGHRSRVNIWVSVYIPSMMRNVHFGDHAGASTLFPYIVCFLWTCLITTVVEAAQEAGQGERDCFSPESELATGVSPRTFYANFWPGICAQGSMQSPINFEDTLQHRHLPANLDANLHLPLVHNITARNTGHALQVEWSMTIREWEARKSLPVVPVGGSGITDVLLDEGVQPTKNVSLVPVQMHFHVASEHMIEGVFHAAELHVVTLVANASAPEWGCDDFWNGGDANMDSCAAVFATLFKIGDQSAEDVLINSFLDCMPSTAGEVAEVTSAASLDLNAFLPTQRSAFAYSGSLTTPGCNEGVRWLVHRHPLTVASSTLSRLYGATANTTVGGQRQIYRTNNRLVQPVNGRTIWHSKDASNTQTPEPFLERIKERVEESLSAVHMQMDG